MLPATVLAFSTSPAHALGTSFAPTARVQRRGRYATVVTQCQSQVVAVREVL